MPALLCRMSRRPNFETAVSSIRRASSSLVTSVLTKTARPPALSMRLTVSAPPVSSRSATTIAAPSFASRRPNLLIDRLAYAPNQYADDQACENVGRQRNISVVAFADKEDEAEC